MEYENQIRKSKSVYELFKTVQEIVLDYTGYEKKGIYLRTKDFGPARYHLIGAFYNYLTNMIVLNTRPIKNLESNDKELINYYVFHILLHEYIHAIGIHDEYKTRRLAFIISKEYFGKSHILTKISLNIGLFLSQLIDRPQKPSQSRNTINDIEIYLNDVNEIINKYLNQILQNFQ